MLGYRLSPRIADLSDQRFWRATAAGDPRGDYGPLNAIARNRVNPQYGHCLVDVALYGEQLG